MCCIILFACEFGRSGVQSFTSRDFKTLFETVVVMVSQFYQKQLHVRQMSRPARKPTWWLLHNLSSQISLRIPRRLIRVKTFRLRVIEVQEAKSVYPGKPSRHA